MAHPCGTGDPITMECEANDEVWENPSEALCSELGVADGQICEDPDTRCVLTQAYRCESSPEMIGASESYLHCRSDEWTTNDAMCPQSSRSVKRGIVYVQPAERAQLAKQILDVKLARYDYIDPKKKGRKLGYILEDSPEATFSGDGRVDIYAYLSALVATTQQQQAQIERLERELKELRDK
ncbi:MAG: hypothetical protein ACI9MC_002649 [Kiritimatiellia bacterium]|jgi:hypothetical protein